MARYRIFSWASSLFPPDLDLKGDLRKNIAQMPEKKSLSLMVHCPPSFQGITADSLEALQLADEFLDQSDLYWVLPPGALTVYGKKGSPEHRWLMRTGDRPNHHLVITLDLGANSEVYTTQEIRTLLESLKAQAKSAIPQPQVLWALDYQESGRHWPVEEGIFFIQDSKIAFQWEDRWEFFHTPDLSKPKQEKTHQEDFLKALGWLREESLILSSSRWNIISLPPPEQSPRRRRRFWTRQDWETALNLASDRSGSKKLRVHGPQEQQLGGVPQRTMVATVQGFAELLDHGTFYHFVDGRWITWLQQQNSTPLSGPVQSWIAYGQKTLGFKTVSSFSLEGDGISGVRESLVCQHPSWSSPARLVIDWYFHEKTPGINVAFSLRLPKSLGPEKTLLLSPLEIPLLKKRTGKKMMLHSYTGSERQRSLEVTRDLDQGLGTGFLLENGQRQIFLTYPQEVLMGHYPLECRLGKSRHGRCAMIYPGGFLTPSSSKFWEGKELHFRLGLHMVDVDAGPEPKALGEKVEHCSLPYLMPW
jgi:hypothetical protein